MLEWLIAGGGIHGCTIAAHLLKQKNTSQNQLKIIDPNPEPLAEWKNRTGFIGMPYLRSPGVHHLDVKPFSLKQYGKSYGTETDFYGTYRRPSLYLFNEHCDSLIKKTNLKEVWHEGMLSLIEKMDGYWKVQTKSGDQFYTKNLVISTGVNQKLFLPEWGHTAKKLAANRVSHVFDKQPVKPEGPIIVIGGGISAAHLTIKLARQFPGQVTQLSRHPYRIHDFDSDPGWLGPKYMNGFSKLSLNEKRNTISKARNKGSIPRDLNNKLHHLKEKGRYSFAIGEVETVQYKADAFHIKLGTGQKMTAKTIYFATGFSPEVMNTDFLSDLIKKENLQCAHCGFPIVNQHLEWCDHLFVSGPLAELELGPSSRNIIGAMKAAERITSASC
ncbi:SidA/IucD/PvdA family monooxygenase [Jeotgalibacillus salarius]|uniref:L-lysine N6-monooxygenase MbtG n=1 Tax=Jeotgalibacillus salarius TaxID=546023 RepID=A0A4Y8LN40_9BACL|nr:FAD/NAD(P)-binding protein [Jeotgalibacillus salarius]TFE02163.1 hypothetical protein E2626_06190 [Jeotgalibacillus salarius]